MSLPLSLAGVLLSAAFVFDPEVNLADVGWSYFAPVCHTTWRGRFPDGCLRYFSFMSRKGDVVGIRSADGWIGRIDGEKVEVVPSPADRPAGSVQKYCFENGCLTGFVQDGKTSGFKYPEVLPCPDAPPPPPWRDPEKMTEAEKDTDTWAGTDRLRLWYRNPNCLAALLAELLVVLGVVAFTRRGIVRIEAILAFPSLVIMLAMTQSRGALLGLGCAVGLMLVTMRGVLRSILTLRRLFLLAVALAAVGAFAYWGGYGRRFANRAVNEGSDVARFATWRQVPEMVASAPRGWNEIAPGLVYVSWFQDINRFLSVRDMMNEHLTFLVMHGWPLRLLYLFGWLAAFAFSVAFVRRGGSPAALGTLTVLAVTASLNRLYQSPTLFIIPVGYLAANVWQVVRRGDCRRYAVFVSGAAVLTAVVAAALLLVGRHQAAGRIPGVWSDGCRVALGGKSPEHWVVNDETMLNGHYSGKEMRAYFLTHPHESVSLGYARRLEDLPDDARHVTLLGPTCRRFVENFRQDVHCRVPERLTFICPTVSPADIPESLRRKCRLEVHLGAFLARHYTEDGTFPEWVKVVGGAEFYLPAWVSLAVGQNEREEMVR